MSGKTKDLQRILLVTSVSYLMAFPFLIAAAANIQPGTIPSAGQIGIKQESPIRDVPGLVGTVADIVSWTYTIFFAVAIVFILFAAFKYLTAVGKPESIQTAHKMIIWAAVAIAIALLAVGAQAIIRDFLGGSGGGTGATLPNVSNEYLQGPGP